MIRLRLARPQVDNMHALRPVSSAGDNSYGQSTVPNGLSGVGQVTAGYSHNCALMSGGDITCWGAYYI